MYFIVNPNDFKGITFALSDDGIHVRELLCDEYDAKTLDDIRRMEKNPNIKAVNEKQYDKLFKDYTKAMQKTFVKTDKKMTDFLGRLW